MDQEKGYWSLKPPWCQPWTIILFGLMIILTLWLLTNSFILVSIITFLISVWWLLFLVIAPKLYEKDIE